MSRYVINAMKIAGAAMLYALLALLVCRTAKVCLWEPFLSLYRSDSIQAWPAFVHYYSILVFVMTALAAFLAGRSYRPRFGSGGVATGCAAALLFRFAERTYYSPGREPDIVSTFLSASLFGMLFGLLGSVSG